MSRWETALGFRAHCFCSVLVLTLGGGGGTAWEVKVNRSEMQEVAKAVVKVGQSSV